MGEEIWGKLEVFKAEKPSEVKSIKIMNFAVKKEIVPIIENLFNHITAEVYIEQILAEKKPDDPIYAVELEWENKTLIGTCLGRGKSALQRLRKIEFIIQRNKLK